MHLTNTRDLSEDEYHFQEWDNPSWSGVGKTTPQNTCDAKHKSTYHQVIYSDHGLEDVVAIGADESRHSESP